MLGDMKLREKSSVFRRCLKISSEGAVRAVDGKLFHARAAATLKTLSPTVERRRCRWLQSVDVAVSQGRKCRRTVDAGVVARTLQTSAGVGDGRDRSLLG